MDINNKNKICKKQWATINILEEIIKIGDIANSSLNLEDVLTNILKNTLEITGTSVGMIFLKDIKTNCLYWGTSIGLSDAFVEDYKNRCIKLGEGLTGSIAQNGVCIYIPTDSSNDPRIARPIVKAENLNSFIGVPIYAKEEIVGVMNILTRPPQVLDKNELSIISSIGQYIGSAIQNARLFEENIKARETLNNLTKNLIGSNKALEDLFLKFITAMVNALDAKSPWTKGHSENVANYFEELAYEMKLNEKEIKKVKLAGLLHDIGKIAIPDNLLNKNGKLTDEEFNIIKRHPLIGTKILEGIEQLKDILPLIKYHHERCDGNGYPDGLNNNEIPLGAKIIHVLDSFDAMTSERPYRPNPGIEYAINELKKYSGTQFDIEIVEAFLRLLAKKHN
ncbi:HD domain-containing protein [Candidatus Poribacteria bacterium]|nr:HD domain-containing protein [Candidatus Poribacteria bacterium]